MSVEFGDAIGDRQEEMSVAEAPSVKKGGLDRVA
jgi:hypothetical protein